MAGFDHGPNQTAAPEPPETAARNARYGLALFAVYLLLYGGYVLVNAFAPQVMEQMLWARVNLAILSGFGLIVAAFVMALFYGWLCRADAPSAGDGEEGGR